VSIATETRSIYSVREEEKQNEEATETVGEGGEAGCNDLDEGREVSTIQWQDAVSQRSSHSTCFTDNCCYHVKCRKIAT